MSFEAKQYQPKWKIGTSRHHTSSFSNYDSKKLRTEGKESPATTKDIMAITVTAQEGKILTPWTCTGCPPKN